MRRFTKEHNELEWLFPFAKNADKMFDEVEQLANYHFENCYGHLDKPSFDEDDMIDSFMKGYSSALQMMTCHPRVSRTEQLEFQIECMQKYEDFRDKLVESLGAKIKELNEKIQELEKR